MNIPNIPVYIPIQDIQIIQQMIYAAHAIPNQFPIWRFPQIGLPLVLIHL